LKNVIKQRFSGCPRTAATVYVEAEADDWLTRVLHRSHERRWRVCVFAGTVLPPSGETSQTNFGSHQPRWNV